MSLDSNHVMIQNEQGLLDGGYLFLNGRNMIPIFVEMQGGTVWNIPLPDHFGPNDGQGDFLGAEQSLPCLPDAINH